MSKAAWSSSLTSPSLERRLLSTQSRMRPKTLHHLTYRLTTSHHLHFSLTISMLRILNLSSMDLSPLTACQIFYPSSNSRSSKNYCQAFKRRVTAKRPILRQLRLRVLTHQHKGQQRLARGHKLRLVPQIATHISLILHFLATHWRLDEGIWIHFQRIHSHLLPSSHRGQGMGCLSVLTILCLA